MRNILIAFISIAFLTSGFSQNLRFSYEVTNPVSGQSKLIVYVQKIGGGTENITSFNYGFYYKSSEATVMGYAPGATDNNMTPSELAGCVDFSYASGLGWAPDGTGAIVSVAVPPAGLPAGYDRLFIGGLSDGNAEAFVSGGSDIGTTPTAIIALLLDNSVGGGSPHLDSAYQGGSDTDPTWKYADFNFEEFDIITVGTRLQPLPIILVSFDVRKYQERSSLISWSTVSELNSSHFLIQRSIDKKSWSTIGKVAAAGTSHFIENYSFVDENVYNGLDSRLSVYYRLQMFDLDGRSDFSPIDNVIFGNGNFQGREFLVYPNPASDGIQVEWDVAGLDQPTSLEFYDVTGKLIYTQKVSDNTNQEYIDFSHAKVQPGLYLLRIMNGTEPIEHKQIVVGQNR